MKNDQIDKRDNEFKYCQHQLSELKDNYNR